MLSPIFNFGFPTYITIFSPLYPTTPNGCHAFSPPLNPICESFADVTVVSIFNAGFNSLLFSISLAVSNSFWNISLFGWYSPLASSFVFSLVSNSTIVCSVTSSLNVTHNWSVYKFAISSFIPSYS